MNIWRLFLQHKPQYLSKHANSFQLKYNDGKNVYNDGNVNQVVELEQRKDANLNELEALRHQVQLL